MKQLVINSGIRVGTKGTKADKHWTRSSRYILAL